jgi:hypothetical protein
MNSRRAKLRLGIVSVASPAFIFLSFLSGCRALEHLHASADGSGAFATGHYRNLFAEAGHS